MKLCKDCKHMTANVECSAPQNMKINRVTGVVSFSTFSSCTSQRVGSMNRLISVLESIGFCGARAKWFEPKDK